MNITHQLSEPVLFTIAIMAAALVAMLWGLYLWRQGCKCDSDLPYVEIDEVQRAIERRNEHCRIKAEYDCHG